MTGIPVYLDHMASTPMDGGVLEAMLPWLRTAADPRSGHDLGGRARDAVERARGQVAALIGADRLGRIVFTSGATEATNMALRGLAMEPGSRCVRSSVEHPCVRDTLTDLGRHGIVTTEVPVDGDGVVDFERLREAIAADPALVTLIAVDGELGTIQPFREAARLCQTKDVMFHSDMAQALGRIPIDVSGDGVAMASLSGHKAGGPPGIGALYLADWVDLRPMATGGGQEEGLRPGAVPTALAVGFGAACALAGRTMASEASRLEALRSRFLARLQEADIDFEVNGNLGGSIPAALNLRLRGVEAADVAGHLFDVCVSTGPARRRGKAEPQRVFAAMGLDACAASQSVRIGFGRATTSDDVDHAAERLAVEVDAFLSRARNGAARKAASRASAAAARMTRTGR